MYNIINSDYTIIIILLFWKMTKTASQWRNSLGTCKSREYKGHRSKVHSLGWNCNGSKLASASTDHAIRIWSLERLLGRDPVSSNELAGHIGSVEQLAWSPVDEHLLASVSTDRTVRFWDTSAAANAALVATIPTASENINLAWSRDGRLLAVGAKDDSICIIDVSVRRIVTQTGFGPVEINEIAWSAAGDELFLTRGSGVIDIVAVEMSETGSGLGVTMGLKQTLAGHTANCYCIRFTPNGRHFAVGGADAIVTLWETLSLACTRTLCRLE